MFGVADTNQLAEREHGEIAQQLVTLQDQLGLAKSARANKIEYDAIAKLVHKLPSREIAQELSFSVREGSDVY